MQIINLCAHAVVVSLDGREVVFPPSGAVARVATVPGLEQEPMLVPAPTVGQDMPEIGYQAYIPVFSSPTMVEVVGLPSPGMQWGWFGGRGGWYPSRAEAEREEGAEATCTDFPGCGVAGPFPRTQRRYEGEPETVCLSGEETAYIVSAIVLNHPSVAGRTDVFAPGTGPDDGAIRFPDNKEVVNIKEAKYFGLLENLASTTQEIEDARCEWEMARQLLQKAGQIKAVTRLIMAPQRSASESEVLVGFQRERISQMEEELTILRKKQAYLLDLIRRQEEDCMDSAGNDDSLAVEVYTLLGVPGWSLSGYVAPTKPAVKQVELNGVLFNEDAGGRLSIASSRVETVTVSVEDFDRANWSLSEEGQPRMTILNKDPEGKRSITEIPATFGDDPNFCPACGAYFTGWSQSPTPIMDELTLWRNGGNPNPHPTSTKAGE